MVKSHFEHPNSSQIPSSFGSYYSDGIGGQLGSNDKRDTRSYNTYEEKNEKA